MHVGVGRVARLTGSLMLNWIWEQEPFGSPSFFSTVALFDRPVVGTPSPDFAALQSVRRKANELDGRFSLLHQTGTLCVACLIPS